MTPSQTESAKADRESFLADQKALSREQRTLRIARIVCLIALSLNLVFSLLILVGAMHLPGGTMNITVALVALLVPFWLKRWSDDRSRIRTGRQLIALNGDGAAVPLAMIERFVSDRDHQLGVYEEFLTKGSAPVSSSGSGFRIILDSSHDSKFVVRVVQNQNGS